MDRHGEDRMSLYPYTGEHSGSVFPACPLCDRAHKSKAKAVKCLKELTTGLESELIHLQAEMDDVRHQIALLDDMVFLWED
jgi:hypothetical protein